MRIGITHSKDYYPKNYILAVERVGAEPFLISTKEHLGSIGSLNAILFSGGGDIAPEIFGQAPHPLAQAPDILRDELELELFTLAQKRSLPILGICRGIQLVNCALGGSLIQHLPNSHLHAGKTEDLWHNIKISANSIMYSLYGEQAMVNSWHHQAVDKIAKVLQPTAYAEDCIEALEGENMLLVQFHPERMGVSGYPVFDWLAEKIKE